VENVKNLKGSQILIPPIRELLPLEVNCPKDYHPKSKRERTVMQINLPPDLETLVNKRLSSGGYASVEDVFRRALEAQDAEESWTDEERRALSAHIEEGFLQAERGELIDGAQARREIQEMKNER
jgi:Arc/MetJ-type ribon-helix-helix transcriptional regulator